MSSKTLRASVLVLLAALGCGSDPATQVLVEIDAADDVKARASFVRLRLEASTPGGDFESVSELGDVTIPVARDGWPRTHVIAPLDGDATRLYRVTARALDDDFRTVAEARRQSGYVAGDTRVLRVFIPGGECLDVTCPDDRTCEQGLCLEVPMIPPELLPRPGEDTSDGGVDGGTTDGGEDGGVCDPTSIECEAEGECETAEVSCDTGEPVCVRTPRGADTVCREAAGECDAEESCDGTSPFCPEDRPVEFGTECTEGFCFGQTCGTCSAGGSCDTGNPCEVGEIQCDAEGVPTCTPMRAADPGTVCRAAIGPCDVAETCQETTCPSDARVPAGETCRNAMGLCDQAEACDGTSPLCPVDAFRSASTVCRASGGACDPEETCSGSGPSCPVDVISAGGTVCRAEATICDVSEVCDGNVRECPTDAFLPFGTACGINPAFVCDGAGKCEETNCGGPCETGRACEIGEIVCDAAGSRCVGRGPRPANTACRAAAGDCDVAESCNGSSLDCPNNAFATATTVCRAAAGDCDAAENCTGTSATCPADQLRASGTECRAAAGVCDRPEFCNGSSPSCPSNSFQTNGTICRAAAGVCDVPEICSGTSASCPTDALRPAGTVCRPGQHVSCDFREECEGNTPQCPTDDFVGDGDACVMRPSGWGGVCTGLLMTPVGDPYRCLDLVISEVRLGASGYVEIYNRFCQSLPLGQCSLVTEGSLGSAISTPLTGFISSGGFFLVGLGVSDADVNAGTTLGTGLANQNGAHFTLVCEGSVVDEVRLTATMPTEAPRPTSPIFCPGLFGPLPMGATERKAIASSTTATMIAGGRDAVAGNAYDTDQDTNDFVCLMGGMPQSTRASAETGGCR
ncbi:MAG: hypothetical protein H6721_23060 [Sandaracinus sp.]|nr:hypothetical protein [Sandaracinus sp.]